MKSADIEINGYYAYTFNPQRRGIGEQLATKVKVISKGKPWASRGRRYATNPNGIEIKRRGEDPQVVAPATILAPWSEYEQAVRDEEEYRKSSAQYRIDQAARDRQRKRLIADALIERGLVNAGSWEGGDFQYTEYGDGSTGLDIPLEAVAKLLGIEIPSQYIENDEEEEE